MVQPVADFAVDTSFAVDTAGVDTGWGVLSWGGCGEGIENGDDEEASEDDLNHDYTLQLVCAAQWISLNCSEFPLQAL